MEKITTKRNGNIVTDNPVGSSLIGLALTGLVAWGVSAIWGSDKKKSTKTKVDKKTFTKAKSKVA